MLCDRMMTWWEKKGRTDDEDAQVVGAEIVEGVVEQLLRSGLGVVGAVGDEVDRFLVRADVPQLFESNCVVSEWSRRLRWQRERTRKSVQKRARGESTHAVTCDDEEVVVRAQSRLGRVRRADHKLFHRRIAEGPRHRQNACLPDRSTTPSANMSQVLAHRLDTTGEMSEGWAKLTVDAIVEDITARVADPFRLFRIAPLVIISQPDRFPLSRQDGPRVSNVGGVERSTRGALARERDGRFGKAGREPILPLPLVPSVGSERLAEDEGFEEWVVDEVGGVSEEVEMAEDGSSSSPLLSTVPPPVGRPLSR